MYLRLLSPDEKTMSTLRYWTTHQPHHPNQCQPGSTWGLRSRLCTSLHFYNTLHWNKGCSRTLAPNTLESGWEGRHIVLFMAKYLSVTEFSALKQKIVSYQVVWSLFVCLFLFVYMFLFTCQFCKLSPFTSKRIFLHFSIHL